MGGQSNIVKLIVGKIRRWMTLLAIRFEKIQSHSSHRLFRHPVVIVADLISIKRGITGQERSFVGRDGLDQSFCRCPGIVNSTELGPVSLNRVQPRDGLGEWHIHFPGGLQRPEDLLFEAPRSLIPKLSLLKGRID